MGEIIEMDETEKLFSNPRDKRTRGLYYGEVWIMRSRFDAQLDIPEQQPDLYGSTL